MRFSSARVPFFGGPLVHIVHGGRLEEFARAHGHAPEKILDFSTNTNHLLDRAPVRELLRRSLEAAFHYPDPEYSRLKEALALRQGVAPDCILPANGSTELLYLIARSRGMRNALILAPAFSEYEAACRAESYEMAFVTALEKDDFVFRRPEPIETIRLARPAAVFVGNPNNPTGRLADGDWLERLASACESQSSLLVIDEAFMDFVPDGDERSFVQRAARSPHIVVLRSLTKFFCIPGLRVGYAVGHPRLIETLAKFQPTWSVNGPAQETALRLLREPAPTTNGALPALRRKFQEALKAVEGIKTYPSDANFFLCRLDEAVFERRRIEEFLGRKGVLVRFCADFRGLEKGFYVRLAVRCAADNASLVETFQEALCHAR